VLPRARTIGGRRRGEKGEGVVVSEERTVSAEADKVVPDNERLSRANVGRLLRKHGSLVAACVLAVVAATFFWTLGQPRLYRSEALLRMDPNPPRPLGNRIELVSDSTSWWNRREFYETELRVIRSTRVSAATVRQLGLHADAGFLGVKGPVKPVPVLDAAKIVSARVTVEPVKDSSLVYLRYEDFDPTRAQRVLATHIRIYLDQNLEQTTALSTTALEWLNDQLGTLKDDLENSERALSDFRLKNNVLSISLEDRHNLITNQLESVIKEITVLEIRRIELAARSSELNAAKQDDPLSATTTDLIENPILTGYRSSYAGHLKDLEELETTLGDSHPKVLAVRAKLEATRKAIENEVKNIKGAAASELRSVDKRLADLRKKDDELQKQAHELQQFEVPFNQLARNKTYNEKIYGIVLERARETSLTRMMNFNNVRVVEDASLPAGHYKPQLSQNVGIGAVLGLVLGLALAALREFSDQSLRTPNEVESMLGVTCLGFVPEISESELGPATGQSDIRDTFVAHRPDSAIAEAVRVIRTNLTFMAPDRPYQVFVVTSALPEEGKTTVSCSLALTLAQSGLRTVLVDADLRRPRLHRTYGLSNDVGVTLAVAGQLPLDEALRPSEFPNLDLLTSGPIPPNPAELLQSERFAKLVKDLRAKYDRVIIDSPPGLPVTDSAILSQIADGTILVVRGFRTPRAAVRQALRRLFDVKGHVIGVVLNAVNLRDTAYKGQYYYTYRGGYYKRTASETAAEKKS
jgi:capsular exopolysaccharide synthesis family protein